MSLVIHILLMALVLTQNTAFSEPDKNGSLNDTLIVGSWGGLDNIRRVLTKGAHESNKLELLSLLRNEEREKGLPPGVKNLLLEILISDIRSDEPIEAARLRQQVTEASLPEHYKKYISWRVEALRVIGNDGWNDPSLRGSVELLLFRDTDPQIREEIAGHIIGNYKGPEALHAFSILRTIVENDPDLEVRARAVMGIGYLGIGRFAPLKDEPQVRQYIESTALNESLPRRIRRQAILAYGLAMHKLEHVKAIDRIANHYISKKDPLAHTALGRFSEKMPPEMMSEAKKTLYRGLREGDIYTQMEALQTLVEIGERTPEVERKLADILTHAPTLVKEKNTVTEFLEDEKLADKERGSWVDRTTPHELRKTAIDLLKKIDAKSAKAKEALEKVSHLPPLEREATWALLELDLASPSLIEQYNHLHGLDQLIVYSNAPSVRLFIAQKLKDFSVKKQEELWDTLLAHKSEISPKEKVFLSHLIKALESKVSDKTKEQILEALYTVGVKGKEVEEALERAARFDSLRGTAMEAQNRLGYANVESVRALLENFSEKSVADEFGPMLLDRYTHDIAFRRELAKAYPFQSPHVKKLIEDAFTRAIDKIRPEEERVVSVFRYMLNSNNHSKVSHSLNMLEKIGPTSDLVRYSLEKLINDKDFGWRASHLALTLGIPSEILLKNWLEYAYQSEYQRDNSQFLAKIANKYPEIRALLPALGHRGLHAQAHPFLRLVYNEMHQVCHITTKVKRQRRKVVGGGKPLSK